MTTPRDASFSGRKPVRVPDRRTSQERGSRTAYAARHELVARLAVDGTTMAAVQAATDVPAAVADWLAGLNLLAGVPFHYLVADQRMLPAESIRFFTVDPNWVAALVDGATAVGARTVPQAAALTALRPGLTTAAATAYSGLLLRSALVSDWPGLQIAGYADAAGTIRTQTVRLERLGPSLLVALFAGIVAHVEIGEPAQALHFGVGAGDAPTVALRSIEGADAGAQLAGDPTCALTLRPDPVRAVLDVTASQQAIQAKLAAPAVGAAALAIQLSIGAQSQPFTAAPTSTGEQHG